MQPFILVAAVGLGVGVSAGAAQYTLLVYQPPQELARQVDTGAGVQACCTPYRESGGAVELRPTRPMRDMSALR